MDLWCWWLVVVARVYSRVAKYEKGLSSGGSCTDTTSFVFEALGCAEIH